MPRLLSDTAQRTLADEPVMYDDDPFVQALHGGAGGESERVTAAAEKLQRGALPGDADDTYGVLSMWERTFGLPVAPEGIEVSDRQAAVSARDGRDLSTGRAVCETLTDLLGTGWVYTPNVSGPWTGEFTVPFASGGYTAAQTLALIDEVLPANLEVTVLYQGHFVLGRSQLGVGAF